MFSGPYSSGHLPVCDLEAVHYNLNEGNGLSCGRPTAYK